MLQTPKAMDFLLHVHRFWRLLTSLMGSVFLRLHRFWFS